MSRQSVEMHSGNSLKRREHDNFVLSCIIDHVDCIVKLVNVRYG